MAFGVGFGFGYFAGKPASPVPVPPLGAALTVPAVSTTTYGTGQQSSLLYSWQFNVVESLTDIRNSLRGVSSTDVTINFTAINATSSITTTTALSGVVAGDFVLISANTSTAAFKDILFVANGCDTDLVCIHANMSTTTVVGVAVDLPSASFSLRLLPDASFIRPDALDVTTSSTPYNN